MKTDRLKRPKKSNKSVAKVQSLRNTHVQAITQVELPNELLPESPVAESVSLRVTHHTIDSERISIPIPTRERHRNQGFAIIPTTHPIDSSTAIVAESKKWSWSKVPLWLTISSLLSMVSLTIFRAKLKSLSRWAAAHPKTSQGLITASQVVVGGTAFVAGGILYDQGFLISDVVKHTALACAVGAGMLYPFHNTSRSYIRRKAHDITLFGAGTILALSVGNNHTIQNRLPVLQQPMIQVQAFANDKIENALTTQVVNQDPEQKPRENIGLKALLTLLALLAFGALGVLVAALSCELSCSGAGALAAVVLVGGAYLVIAGAAAVIRKIWGLKRRRDRVAEAVPTT